MCLGRMDVPPQLELPNRKSHAASHLRKQWAHQAQGQQTPITHPLVSAMTAREEEEQRGPTEALQGKASHHELPHPPEVHFSPTLSDTFRPLRSSSAARSRKLLLKSHSVGSMGSLGASSESPTMSSLWEACSFDTVPDFLSSLGFDDFDSPNLIPDRFITSEVECAKPSFMRQATLGSLGLSTEQVDDIPLGATAETVIVHEPQEAELAASCTPDMPPLEGDMSEENIYLDEDKFLPPQTLAIYNPSNSQIPREPASLETVLEETGSDLVSPRRSPYLSPRLSIERTPSQERLLEQDVCQGLLGASLAQRLRPQPLQLRESRRQSLLSLGESEGSSLYLSVASHLEEQEREGVQGKEEEEGERGPEAATQTVQEVTLPQQPPIVEGGRWRRRGHYAPPPQLLTWLSNSESLEDEEEQPWPFSESPHAERRLSDVVGQDPANPAALAQELLQTNSNSSNSNLAEFRLKLRRARYSAPAGLKNRQRLYLHAEILSLCNGVHDASLDESGIRSKVRGMVNCLSVVDHNTVDYNVVGYSPVCNSTVDKTAGDTEPT